MNLKQFLPYSLFGRFLLIIILPSIFIQSIAIYIFYNKHWENVSKYMALSLAGDVAYIVNHYKSDPNDNLTNLINDNMYLKVSVDNNNSNFDKHIKSRKKSIARLEEILGSKLDNTFYINQSNKKNFKIHVLFESESLIFDITMKRIDSPSTHIFTTWVISTTIFFIFISIMFMRNQIRSIVNISSAADKYMKNQDFIGFKPSGAMEVRHVAKSFISMKNSLKRHVEQRTAFLAGVSHDLKTPLTRIKLHLDLLEASEDIEEIKSDVKEMEKMIQGYLQFAKGNKRQPSSMVDIADLLQKIVVSYKNHYQNISLNIEPATNIKINSNSLKRVLNNLIDNAIRYADNVAINVESSKKYLVIQIEDDGAGIAEDKREEVFKPFYRIDESRHLDSANTGLGLSIAKDIVTSYNGRIELGNSQMGGLLVTVKLPV